ncbi:hypothetical protein BaRGS_00018170 [Batillaria attramentaria]|uniref:Dolichyl-diphosphooligosaccharide--protein glycosyltransferase subunit 1 n=1 Tax=Batillaria attramentaria TaxID=370345 RepID=A0ABD0KU18_9CAEN
MKWRAFYILLLPYFASVLCTSTIDKSLVVTQVERKIDIASHLVKTYTSITIENKGSASVRSFLFVIDPTLQNKVSFIGAVTKDNKDDKLQVVPTTVTGHSDKQFWKVTLRSELSAGKSVTVEVEAVFAHALSAYPSQITQAEKQYVVFEGNLYFYSPYETATQKTIVTTASSTLESYTKTKPVSASDNVITYGPYENRPPFSEAQLRVHEENNSPFLTVTSMERIIEVSHWGNIAIEEHVDLRHSGATLKGPFSRFDYQRSQDGVSSIKSFKTILPASARDVYYRDEIGNISTSHMRELDDAVDVELRPRFPLFGGWKTRYFLGYNVPSYEYLFNKGDSYALKMRFVDHVYDDMVVDEAVVKVILPEGSKNIEVRTPFKVKREPDELHFTYLDTTGRPVVVMRKENLVEQHIQDFELHYTFQRMLLLQEPLLVVGAFYLLFLVVIIYVRLDFSITKDEAKESRLRVASLVEEVQSTQDRRSALYQSYDDAINRFKTTKDTAAFQASRKKVDADYKQLTTQVQNIYQQLKTEGTDIAEKVAELQRLDGQYKDQINLAITLAEKLVAGKASRQQYLDSEAGVNTKREDIYQKMEALRATL